MMSETKDGSLSADWQREAFRAALKMVENGPPKDLVSRAQPEAAERGTSLSATDLTVVLGRADATDPFLNALGMQVHKWDAALPNEEWTMATAPSSSERRHRICELLGLDSEGTSILLDKRPLFRDETLVITAPWDRWYTAAVADDHAFYWPRYRDYLLNVRGWPESSVTSLDIATSDVVERLANPTRMGAYQSKGLVVGYVQSGKTANFTGVAAKAIDAGYRLVIVMTGTIEMLRAQTQRRMDMEMVGRQNILADLSPEQALESKVDYQDDDAWLAGEFIDLGGGELATEIRRLTQHRKDYQKQFRTLKIDRFDMGRPLYDPQNLFRSAARVAIVKKNATVLRKLVTDIKANKNAFAEIPVLVIDDESDQASINTVDPEKVRAATQEGKDIKKRRAINEQIATMLELMPRTQYVGYTATPFANVFVDPSDPQSIFPKDFVIGLQRPPDYMGLDDFHDLEEPAEGEPTFANSNQAAFVRHLEAGDDDLEKQDQELAEAIDCFVLTGAVKLYRETMDSSLPFQHHTMLVHDSVRTADHKDIAERAKALWKGADFANPSGKSRLRALYERDIRPVSMVRTEEGVPPAPDFDTLAAFVPKAIGRIMEHNDNPVIVVNSDKDIQQQQQSLDFDRRSTWRILVGGAKLSRGFTVEGLTITYFRRATNMSDSLTQMGRWFGFRRGYRDLVRLYIARHARFGAKTIDLYEAFQSVAYDEAAFRKQLELYAEWEGDRPRIRPIEIPPLVTQHLPWLQPTSRNKMFNAVLVEQSEQPFTSSGYANRLDLLKQNLDLWRPVLQAAQRSLILPEESGSTNFNSFVGLVDATALVEIIEQTHYLYLYGDKVVRPRTTFYRRLIESGALKDFLIIVPQPATEIVELRDVGPRSVISRDRRGGRGGKFGEFTDRKHRPVAEDFANAHPAGEVASMYTPTRGAMLLYVARESEPDYEPSLGAEPVWDGPERGLIAAFSAYVPCAALARDPLVLKFRVLDTTKGDAPTIDAPTG
jgi:hypothetical protein